MHRAIILAPALALQALPLAAVLAQEISVPTLEGFIDNTGAARACIISKDADRPVRNVLVWPQNGRLAALIFRADLPQNVGAAAPCWSGNGTCVLYEGLLAGAADLCETSPGLSSTGVERLRQRNDQEGLAPDLEAIAAALMPMAADLIGEETWVALLDGHAVYMAEGERGTRRVRIVGPNGPFTIARLRPSWDTLNLAALEAAMVALGSRDLALVGPEGVLSADGRLYIGGRCFGVASAAEVRNRLEAANAVFALETPPDAAGEDPAFDDIVQSLLGGTPAYGAPVTFVPEQDPLTLLFLPHQMNLCP